MIKFENGIFTLTTRHSAYIFEVDKYSHLSHIHYGVRVDGAEADALRIKNNITLGSATEYTKDSANYCLDTELLEYSGIGKGDYRHSPCELIMPDGSFVCDFLYESHEIYSGSYECRELPTAYGDAETLAITLADAKYKDIKLKLNFTVYEDSDVIARNVELINGSDGDVFIRKLMSFMHDHPRADFDIITLNGGWAREAHLERSPASLGIHVNDSTTGDSSNRHNPGFLIARRDADYEAGDVYAYNLIYSGNHYSAVERSSFDTLRVMSGINPHCFLWKLKGAQTFVTPQAVMTYSPCGINGASANMHSFINENIVRGEHKSAERPVVINNWEATFFNFNRRKILALARRARRLGIEMFVLDDGWFGKRASDNAGLGDWKVNRRKLPGGIKALARRINRMGMRFGLWFEPECVNEDSDLYRAHPDWAIKIPDREASVGRHQLVLDLTRSDVREYI
ncbi:MAG: alpha-galactosidase, partial [Clostridia bacterium]|nr:alpha-galactosidase [Clostridia bacterium]